MRSSHAVFLILTVLVFGALPGFQGAGASYTPSFSAARPGPEPAVVVSELRDSQEYTADPDGEYTPIDPIDRSDLHLLTNPETTSPRATLRLLLDSVQEAYKDLAEAYVEHRSTPGFGVSRSVAEKVAHARLLLHRGMEALDLSQVPAVNREKTGIETALLLKEVFDRLPELQMDTVPGHADVNRKQNPITDWTVPYSDIHITKMTDGPDAGEFLISAESVAQARSFYDIVRQYAERPDAQKDFFAFYTLTPGDLLPPKWYLWIERLPAWTRTSILDQAIWQWAGMVIVLGFLLAVFWAVKRIIGRRITKATSLIRRSGLRMTNALVLAALAFFAQWLIADNLNITGWPHSVVNTILFGTAYFALAWAAYLLCVGIAEFVISSPKIDPSGIDASMLRITARLGGIAAGVVIIFYGTTQIGISLYGVIAGLGVGGLALGLAARPTLENLIGGLILYTDRPVRVGDFCQFGDKMGTVEAIGLRSTRIRALDRTLITISNAEFSNMQLINFSQRDQILMKTDIRLRYETTEAQMRDVLERIRTLLLEHPEIDSESVRVRFRDLGVYALGIEAYAYVDTTLFPHFLEVQEEIYLKIMQIVEACGTALAFPSTTTYHVVKENGSGHSAAPIVPLPGGPSPTSA